MKSSKFLYLLVISILPTISTAQEITTDASEICPILVGETLPDGQLKDLNGNSIPIKELLKEGPTVMIYYRGGWCPYCNKQLASLNEVQDEIIKLGFNIIAVSADNPKHIQETKDKKELKYDLYSDASMAYARKLGVAFKVDDKTIKKYKTFGIDLEESSGESHFQLPAPAVFVIDKKGLIHFSYINPNYKVRLDAEVLIAILKNMKL